MLQVALVPPAVTDAPSRSRVGLSKPAPTHNPDSRCSPSEAQTQRSGSWQRTPERDGTSSDTTARSRACAPQARGRYPCIPSPCAAPRGAENPKTEDGGEPAREHARTSTRQADGPDDHLQMPSRRPARGVHRTVDVGLVLAISLFPSSRSSGVGPPPRLFLFCRPATSRAKPRMRSPQGRVRARLLVKSTRGGSAYHSDTGAAHMPEPQGKPSEESGYLRFAVPKAAALAGPLADPTIGTPDARARAAKALNTPLRDRGARRSKPALEPRTRRAIRAGSGSGRSLHSRSHDSG